MPTSLTSPTKLLAQRENKAILEHSRSSTNLKARADVPALTGLDGSGHGKDIRPNGAAPKPPRPGTRRRSTLNWVNESPEIRQKLLEDAVVERRVDSFLSLHAAHGEDDGPIYVSELRERSMNPDFQFFSLKENGAVSRDDTVTVKIWATPEHADSPTLLLQATVHLPSLVRIGRSLETFYHPLPDNCIVFYMTDGIYTSFVDLGKADGALNPVYRQPVTPRTSTFAPLETSSFDALMKLRNLAECIDDALQTQATVTKQIEEMIQKSKSEGEPVVTARAASESVESVEAALAKTTRALANLRADKQKREASLEARRTALKAWHKDQKSAEDDLRADDAVFQGRIETHRQLQRDMSGQTRRIAEHLLEIFPIEPIKGKPLCFTIRGLFLPNAKTFEHEASSYDSEATAAALGYAAHIVALLEAKLAVALPYLVTVRGSTSEIFDPLSSAHELGSTVQLPPGERPTPENSHFRIFPLYLKGTALKRFKCGVYLLNKNVEELMSKHGLRVMDPRNTLANLKYLLTVLASGPGEIPKRKAGEIRALSPRTWPVKEDRLGIESPYREVSPISFQRS